MKNISRLNLLFFILFSLTIPPAAAENMSATEVVRLSRTNHETPYEQVQVRMTLTDRQGKDRHRELAIFAKTDEGGFQKSVIRFTAPRNVEGTALLTMENDGAEADQWLFLPILKRAKRIAVSDKSRDFVGTDFSYEDLQPEQVPLHTYTMLRSETVDGSECFVIEARPVNRGAVKGYAKRHLWIRKDNFMVVRIDYVDADGNVLKRRFNRELVQVDKKRWRANRVIMENFIKNHKTVVVILRRDIVNKIPDRVFTVNALEHVR